MDFVTYLNNLRAEAIGASGKRSQSKARLLDDADMNIGNAVTVLPPLNAAVQTIPTQNPDRILNLDALSKTGQMVSIAFSASLTPGNGSPLVGPITGIVEFGNGAIFSRVEVDIPIGPYNLLAGGANGLSNQPFDGGTILTLPGGVIRAYARHDGHFITLSTNGSTGGAVPVAATTAIVPVIVKAHAAYYVRAGVSSPRKTLYTGLANPNGLVYSIPAYAKRFRLLRDPRGGNNTAVWTAAFLDSAAAGGNVLVTAVFDPAVLVSSIPFVEVPGTANSILLTSAGGVTTTNIFLEFEIGF